MVDLYPDPSWNFVFGQADMEDRVGAFSFARYDPLFYGDTHTSSYKKVLLRRCLKVMVHETAHMFGLRHCIYFKCVMNGSNHLKESDARPLSVCPVCMRKIEYNLKFDIVNRYKKLVRFYQDIGLDKEVRWAEKRLRWISKGDEDR